MGRFEGVPQRDLAQRKILFEAVKKLKADGLSYNAIIAEVEKQHGVRLSKSHVSGWLTGSAPSRWECEEVRSDTDLRARVCRRNSNR